MITSESFSESWISHFPEANSFARKQTIERCIYAFYLLERLSKKNFPFVFKGGTSLMLILPEPKRFSVDIDIITDLGFSRKSIKSLFPIVL
jgi:predicted nucleotidyltransferase component of viral defense system